MSSGIGFGVLRGPKIAQKHPLAKGCFLLKTHIDLDQTQWMKTALFETLSGNSLS